MYSPFQRFLSVLMIQVLFFVSFAPSALPQDTQEQNGQQEKKSKNPFKKLPDWAKKAKDAVTDPHKAANQIVAQSLGNVFNDHLPLKLDARTAFTEVPALNDFKPVPFTPTLQNINQPLPPGDYAVPVVAFCTKDSIHVPGKGVGYKLAPLQGKQADAISALVTRGTLSRTSHNTLQTIAWSIQASIPYSQMPQEHRNVIDRLIPEYRKVLDGDFLQAFDNQYQQFANQYKGLPPLDTLLNQMGETGNAIRSVRRSREIIRQNSLNYERMQQQLYDGPPEDRVLHPSAPQISPWTQIRPGVFTQVIIEDGWQGINRLNLRITGEATTGITSAVLPAASLLRTSYSQQRTSSPTTGTTLAQIFGFVARPLQPLSPAGVVTEGGVIAEGTAEGVIVVDGIPIIVTIAAGVVIAYSVLYATQALILFLDLRPSGDCTEERHRALQNAVESACGVPMACTAAQSCAILRVNIARFKQCIDARETINEECFKGGDPGHIAQVNQRRNGLNNCLMIYATKCK